MQEGVSVPSLADAGGPSQGTVSARSPRIASARSRGNASGRGQAAANEVSLAGGKGLPPGTSEGWVIQSYRVSPKKVTRLIKLRSQ